MKRYILYLVMCVMTMAAGCSHMDEYISIAKRTAVSNSYYAALNSWTREKAVYSQFETTIRIVATLKSGEFIDAYLAEYNAAYMIDAAHPSLKQDIVMERSTKGVQILLYAYMPDKQSNNLSSPRSLWQLGLITDSGETVTPEEVREIEEITPLIEKLFPYVNKYYGKFYRITFASPATLDNPAVEGGPARRAVKLVCTGILGRAELEWEARAPQ